MELAPRIRKLIWTLTALCLAAACSTGTGIMTFEEFRNNRPKGAYVVQLQSNQGGELLYFGSPHSFDPRDLALHQLEDRWSDFDADVALYEGRSKKVPEAKKKAIRRMGERGLLRWLAGQAGVPTDSLEPSRKKVVSVLLESYPAADVKAFFVLRIAASYRQRSSSTPLKNQMRQMLVELSAVEGLAGPPNTFDEFEAVCQSRLPEGKSWRHANRRWFDPAKDSSPFFTNAISRAAAIVRDRHMVDLLAGLLKDGKKVFAVVGSAHVVMQERALEHALKEPEKEPIEEPVEEPETRP